MNIRQTVYGSSTTSGFGGMLPGIIKNNWKWCRPKRDQKRQTETNIEVILAKEGRGDAGYIPPIPCIRA